MCLCPKYPKNPKNAVCVNVSTSRYSQRRGFAPKSWGEPFRHYLGRGPGDLRSRCPECCSVCALLNVSWARLGEQALTMPCYHPPAPVRALGFVAPPFAQQCKRQGQTRSDCGINIFHGNSYDLTYQSAGLRRDERRVGVVAPVRGPLIDGRLAEPASQVQEGALLGRCRGFLVDERVSLGSNESTGQCSLPRVSLALSAIECGG